MRASFTDNHTTSRWPDRLAWLLLLLLAVIALLTFRDYGLGWDDYTHAQYGDLVLSLYTSGFRDTRALTFVNLYLYGGGFDMASAAIAKLLPFDLFETRRLIGAAVGLVGLFATWRIARRVGGPVAGLVALALLATCPLYYGHMFINPKDGPFAAMMAIFLLGLVRLIEEHPRPSVGTLAILGIGFGLSIGSRVMAGFGVIEAVLALALLFVLEAQSEGFHAARTRFARLSLLLIPTAILAYAVMGLVWPWGVANPLNPIAAIETFSHFFEKPWQELFEGQRLTPVEMPWDYVPLLMALKLPEILLLLGCAGVAGLLVAACRGALAPRPRAIYFGIALAAALPVLVTLVTRPAMYNGIRHFVFVMPPLAVAGGLAGAWIAERAARFGRFVPVLLAFGFAAGVALPVVEMARLHPYEYVFYNHIIGGVRGAQTRFMLDYWGLAFKQAGAQLRETLRDRGETPPAGRKWKVAVCGPHPPAQIALGDDFEPTWEPQGADFALMLGTFYCARFEAPVLTEVTRDGVTFARAYDLRGLSFSNMFTVPPVK
ncbi:glycosyltransferase family 39 protein [Rhodoplanes sp. Z2-YC6860]|uniref:glycosyltransferase family 39 protein n=1 Tax=Rhodoplanes sp. Z2-YC6860 TaxID=674703 RepID=UPI00078B9502|nr:glycosyltransferase family 39 protein [Rhodoplanes sp. Z2-YC6860]AMN41345.1 family 2 glycosyl transferase [Rhodoplanes sp. Z2-YC6860]